MIVTNHGLAAGTFTVVPNAEALRLPSDKLGATEHVDLKTSKPLLWKADGFEIDISAKDFRIVSIAAPHVEGKASK